MFLIIGVYILLQNFPMKGESGPPDQGLIQELLFDGKSIWKEKETVKEKDRAKA
jgi:hypothetical protein